VSPGKSCLIAYSGILLSNGISISATDDEGNYHQEERLEWASNFIRCFFLHCCLQIHVPIIVLRFPRHGLDGMVAVGTLAYEHESVPQ
jgi:hypothetical protein